MRSAIAARNSGIRGLTIMNIMGMGSLELVIIAVAALLIFGPERLPEVAPAGARRHSKHGELRDKGHCVELYDLQVHNDQERDLRVQEHHDCREVDDHRHRRETGDDNRQGRDLWEGVSAP
jgi:hypothetical protein